MGTPTESPAPASFLLTPQERERFAAWLENEAVSGRAIAEQIEKMNLPVAYTLAAKERALVGAALMIAHKLRSIKDVSIG